MQPRVQQKQTSMNTAIKIRSGKKGIRSDFFVCQRIAKQVKKTEECGRFVSSQVYQYFNSGIIPFFLLADLRETLPREAGARRNCRIAALRKTSKKQKYIFTFHHASPKASDLGACKEIRKRANRDSGFLLFQFPFTKIPTRCSIFWTAPCPSEDTQI